MGFPRRLLADHERIVLDLRPHWIALAWPAAVTVLLVLAEHQVLTRTPEGWTALRWAAVLAGVAVFLAYPVRLLLAWGTSHFVVTTDRVIHRAGWLAKRSMEIPLERINDVAFRQSVLERLVGAGDLIIESGGEYGQNHFRDIRHPERVQKTIFEASESNRERMLRGAAGGPASPLEEIERLARLRERGLLTEEEFETHKRRLLGRL